VQSLNVEESKEFRDFLRETGYNTQALIQCFGHTEIPQVHLLKLFMVGIVLEHSRLHILLRWFWIGSPVEMAIARQYIPERIIELFLKSEVLIQEDGNLTSLVRISPFNDFFILSDHVLAKSGTLHTNTVLWPNPTSMLCYHLSMQTPVGRTLDLGTGNGILALTAAGHSGEVIATDLNPRAREFCLFNAALNGFDNIEYREGNAFEPVHGERFDLILANPPFFVTPTVRRVYSDNGMELDGFCRTLIRQAPDHLNEGAYCQLLVEWVQLTGQPWRDRLSGWFEGIGCDVWVMVDYMRSSLDYALIRLQEDRDQMTDASAQAALTSTWQKYFEEKQVEAIFGGIIVLRRRAGKNWVRMEELKALPTRPFGDFMRRVFDSRDFLETHSDEELLGLRPAAPSTARLHKQYAMSPEGWKLSAVDMQLDEGLPYSLTLQPQVGDFVGLCDGKRTLGEIADKTAAAVSVDPALVRKESCKIVRQLADRGMILI
jgi:methylase of polypeptide subunit release factors